MSAPPRPKALPIRAAVFDIGGVFFPWPSPSFFARWASRLGMTPGDLQPRLWHGPDIEAANIGAITAEEYCRRCAQRLAANEAHVREIVEAAFAGERLNEALVAHVRGLRAHVRVAALTNTWSFGRVLIERRGITDLFDVIVTSAEEGVRKPAAAIYEVTLQRLAVAADVVVFIDDSSENVAAARALGMRGIVFRSTGQAIAELDALLSESGRAGAQLEKT